VSLKSNPNFYREKMAKEFALPDINGAMDASKAASSVLTAVSEGKLTPTYHMGLIDSYRRSLELTEIEERLQGLENIIKLNDFILG